jgi:undecaprenyl-diphosphatase
MTALDELVVLTINRNFAGRWPNLDELACRVADSELLKGAVFAALLWYFWFRRGDRDVETRLHVLTTLVGAFSAVILARVLALLLPFRSRPYIALGSLFVMPAGMVPESLERWSSFPSDHAAVFVGFVTGIALRAPRLGLVAAVYATVVIMAPRLYLGIHWPTDLLAGALVGAGSVMLASRTALVRRWSRMLLQLGDRAPGAFYAAFFMVMFEVVTLFDSVRAFGRLALTTLRATGHPLLYGASLLTMALCLLVLVTASLYRRRAFDLSTVLG